MDTYGHLRTPTDTYGHIQTPTDTYGNVSEGENYLRTPTDIVKIILRTYEHLRIFTLRYFIHLLNYECPLYLLKCGVEVLHY